MAAVYHGNRDLTDIRPDIFNYGVEDFTVQMEEAESIINRVIESRWYRNNAINYSIDWRSTPFNSTLLLTADTQLRRLASYKSLQLIYLHLMKVTPNADGFERQSETFKKLYQDELNEVLTAGLDYDWDESGSLASDETLLPRVRRLKRV